MRLYEIANEFQMLLNEIDQEGLNETTQQKLVDLEAKAEDKIKNIGYMIKTLEGEKEIIDREYKRLESKRKTYETNIDWLRNYASREMQRLHIDKVQNKPYFNVNLRQGKPKLNPSTLNDELIPTEYKNVVQTINIDKKRIVDEMLLGVAIPGAELIRECYIEIR